MTKSVYNITRMDYFVRGKRSALGWAVRVSIRGRVRHRLFSDSRYGGKAKALAAAIAYRDQLLQEVANKVN